MNVAIKKVELIEWLARLQDESILERIEALRKGSAEASFRDRTPQSLDDLQIKLDRATEDIKEGRTVTQSEAEAHFNSRFQK